MPRALSSSAAGGGPQAGRAARPDVLNDRREIPGVPTGLGPIAALSGATPARLGAAAPLGLPSRTPRLLATASASLVRLTEIASRSCCATSAMMPTVRSMASGRSQQDHPQSGGRSGGRGSDSRPSWRSSAVPVTLARWSTLASCGRSGYAPAPTSIKPPRIVAPRCSAKSWIFWRGASSACAHDLGNQTPSFETSCAEPEPWAARGWKVRALVIAAGRPRRLVG